MMSSCRSRIEIAQFAERSRVEAAQRAARLALAAQITAQRTQAAEDERRERLAQNARKIQEDRVNTLLLEMTETESEVVSRLCSPSSLGNPVVLEAILTRVRTEGVENLREAMNDSSPEEKSAVWGILKDATAEEKLGMDGGRACRAALEQVRHEKFMNEEG